MVVSLSPEFTTQVRDIILRVPDALPYDTLKQQLITRTALPTEHGLQQLFQSTELGDKRPAQLLLKELFLQRLPANVHMVLASSMEGKTLGEIAQLADKVTTAAPPAIGGVKPHPQGLEEMEELRTEIAGLKEMVATLATSSQSPRQHTSPRCMSRLRSPPPPSTTTQMCWYHSRFRARACKCTPPCSYSGKLQGQ